MPKTMTAHVLAKQVLRSGCSIGANYREAGRARTNTEFHSKISISLAECDETAWWLDLIAESATLPAERLADLQAENQELTAILTTIAKKTQKKQRPA